MASWFESQIEERREADDARMSVALQKLVSAVTGREAISDDDAARQAETALEAILAFYGFKAKEPPRGLKGVMDLVEFQLRPTGIMYREVKLTRGWHKDAIGPMLGFTKDGAPVALIPSNGGYRYNDPATGSAVRVTSQAEAGLEEMGLCFYRPLPSGALKVRDLLAFMLRTLSKRDYAIMVATSVIVAVLGLVLPIVNQIIFGPVAMADDAFVLVPVFVLLIGVEFSQLLITGIRTIILSAIGSKLSVTIEAAVMMRVLRLPASFFKDYSPGDLVMRIQGLTQVVTSLTGTVIESVLTAAFSLVYIGQIFVIAPVLAFPAFAIILLTFLVTLLTGFVQVRVTREQLKLSTKLSGWQYELIGGVQKIKLAGAERRGFATWAERYAPVAKLIYNGPLLARLATPLALVVSLVGTIFMYFIAYENGVSVADYMAYTSAFGMVTGAFQTLSQATLMIAAIQPQLELTWPILDAEPEVNERRPVLERVSGSVEVDNVTFAYGEGQKPVLDGLSLKIKRGQYVAIVGKSGCGKSTLIRLLLGFEKPNRGAIYYDGRDISAVDVASLRKHIGVVLQDGKLFQGDIFNNIIISAPLLTMDDAWEAAELAGIADDIRAMPMGMFTMVSEGGGGVSGGQRQRLMIARAIAPKPSILIFDEATSALDNITQRIVSESLDTLKCTRIVVAHRLSTIRTCDRIVLLENGGIAEDGTYEELMAKRGKFYTLVKRQQLEEGEA